MSKNINLDIYDEITEFNLKSEHKIIFIIRNYEEYDLISNKINFGLYDYPKFIFKTIGEKTGNTYEVVTYNTEYISKAFEIIKIICKNLNLELEISNIIFSSCNHILNKRHILDSKEYETHNDSDYIKICGIKIKKIKDSIYKYLSEFKPDILNYINSLNDKIDENAKIILEYNQLNPYKIHINYTMNFSIYNDNLYNYDFRDRSGLNE